MKTSAAAVIVVHQSLDHPAVLLVKSAGHWGVPEGRCVESVRTELLHSLFPRAAALVDLPIAPKDFSRGEGLIRYVVVHATTSELNPYVDSPSWSDARWASFDEAFHIGRADQEEMLQWVERFLRKHPVT